ncbi:hypothetical protein ADL21_18155 [Streptomyces albus subsp. albus]|nr:hypothetical protein ADL21_18155 [Streptomyces albus subsp. albus]
MAEEFQCDYDGGTLARVQADPDGYVEVEFRRVDDGPEAPVYLYLTPEAARGFARTVTLASIVAEGEVAPEVPNGVVDASAGLGVGSEEASREEQFRTARTLAGPTASVDDVLRVAAFLAA